MLRAVLLSCNFHDGGKENNLHKCHELLKLETVISNMRLEFQIFKQLFKSLILYHLDNQFFKKYFKGFNQNLAPNLNTASDKIDESRHSWCSQQLNAGKQTLLIFEQGDKQFIHFSVPSENTEEMSSHQQQWERTLKAAVS